MRLLRSLTVVFLLVTLMVAFAGCSSDEDNNTTPALTMFEQIAARGEAYFGAGTKNITAAALFDELGDENLVIIDWRSQALYDAGHVPGARFWYFTTPDVLTDSLAQFDKATTKFVNYCYSGQTASQATCIMNLMGYDAWNLKFGASGWNADVNSGWVTMTPNADLFALLTDGASPALTDYDEYPEIAPTATDVDGAIAELAMAYWNGAGVGSLNAKNTDVIMNENRFADPDSVFIINYWPAAAYELKHIDGAVNFDTGDLTLKSLGMDALAKIPMDKKIVVYCYTGMTSSQVAAYLKVLGYDAYTMSYGISGLTNDATYGGVTYDPSQFAYEWEQ
ncbi:MAG: rhodanese-like domain-containing protein [bacterium]